MTDLNDTLVPNGWYRAVIAHRDGKQTSAAGNRFRRITFVLLDGKYAGKILFGHYVYPEDSAAASFAWEDVVDHPDQLERGLLLKVQVMKVEQYEREFMCRASKLAPLEAPEQITRTFEGVTYRYKLEGPITE